VQGRARRAAAANACDIGKAPSASASHRPDLTPGGWAEAVANGLVCLTLEERLTRARRGMSANARDNGKVWTAPASHRAD
jgi:hypothetical protein